MKLLDLYNRVVETTGLDVVTLESIQAAVANCMADLTSRGYKVFKEVSLNSLAKADNELIKFYEKQKKEVPVDKLNILHADECSVQFRMPKDLRKALYCKCFFHAQATKATRYNISNPRIDSKVVGGVFRTELDRNSLAVFYIKHDVIHVEWRPELKNITEIQFGYYQRLTAPKMNTSLDDVKQLADVDIDIREEFEDALVFYTCYFYYSRYIKDTDKIQLYQNNYKYYVEDIVHELSYEDEFFEEDAVISTYEED